MEEKNVDAQVEQETVEQKETTVEETQDKSQEETHGEEAISISKDKFKAMQRKAMAYDALKKNPPSQPEKKNINSELTREDVILLTKGYDEESLNEITAIAKGKGISKLEAEASPLFIAWKDVRDREKKAEQAKLGASKGSAAKERKPDFTTVSVDEHRKLWEEQNNS